MIYEIKNSYLRIIYNLFFSLKYFFINILKYNYIFKLKMFVGTDLKNQFLKNMKFDNVYIIIYIIIILLKIQGHKIYLGDFSDAKLFDIQSTYEKDKNISCRLLVEGKLTITNLKEKIKEAIQNFPRLNGLKLEVLIDLKKISQKKKLEVNENTQIINILKTNDEIYFDIKFEEVWLNINLSLKEKKFETRQNITFNPTFDINIDVKIPKKISEEKLNNKLLNVCIDFLGFRSDKNAEENDFKTETEIKSKSIEENDEIDYYLFFEFSVEKNENKENINNKNKTMIDNDNNKINNLYNKSHNSSKGSRIEMQTLNNNEKSTQITFDENEDNKEKNNILEKDELEFGIKDERICNVSYINFTNFILSEYIEEKNSQLNKDDKSQKCPDFQGLKQIFNRDFGTFCKSHKLKEMIEMRKDGKLILIYQKKKDIKDIKSYSFKYTNKEYSNRESYNENSTDPIFKEIISKIDFNKKLNQLKNYYIFKDDFSKISEINNIRYNKTIEKGEKDKDDKAADKEKNNKDLIVEENINYGNNNNLKKRAILIGISVILFIVFLILLKIF